MIADPLVKDAMTSQISLALLALRAACSTPTPGAVNKSILFTGTIAPLKNTVNVPFARPATKCASKTLSTAQCPVLSGS